MKNCAAALVALALLAVPAAAQDDSLAKAQTTSSRQINEHSTGLKAWVQAIDRKDTITGIHSEACVTTIRVQEGEWIVDWRNSAGIEVRNPEALTITEGDGRPWIVLAVDEKDEAQVKRLALLARSMDDLWLNCE